MSCTDHEAPHNVVFTTPLFPRPSYDQIAPSTPYSQTPSALRSPLKCEIIQCVPLATEPGISLIILPLIRILQRNLKRTTDTFHFISHTTNVLLFKFRCNIFIGVTVIKEMPGSVASGTHCTSDWYESTGEIIDLCILIFAFVDSKREDRSFWIPFAAGFCEVIFYSAQNQIFQKNVSCGV